MPVVAVVGAAFAVSAAVTATTVFSVITAIGAVAGAVGAVTGNQRLMKIGAIVGIAGGIGSMLSSSSSAAAGLSSTPNSAAGGMADLADLSGSANSMVNGVSSLPTEGLIGQAATGGVEAGFGMAYSPPVPDGLQGVPGADPTAGLPAADMNATNNAAGSVFPGDTPVKAPADLAAEQMNSGYNGDTATPLPGVTNSVTGTQPLQEVGGSTLNSVPTVNQSGGFFDTALNMGKGLTDWADKNKMAASMLYSSIASAADPSARNLRAAQEEQSKAQTEATRQQVANSRGIVSPVASMNPDAINRIRQNAAQGLIANAYRGG